MFRGLLLLMLGAMGFATAGVLTLATPAQGQVQTGPCQVFLGGCFCVWDAQKQKYKYCHEHQWQASWCQGISGACYWFEERKCFVNYSTTAWYCPDASCAMDCEHSEDQCQLFTPDCLHP